MLNAKAQAQLERLVEAFRTGEVSEVVRRRVSANLVHGFEGFILQNPEAGS